MSNPKVYVIADLHFGHKKVEEFRPFGPAKDHDAELIQRWNSKVRVQDAVWVLGDVAFPKWALVYLPRLRGTKKLVLGNHDLHRMEDYQYIFSKIYGAFEYKGCILTHIPVHESELSRFRLNVHGHLHDKKIDDPRYRCVSAEQVDYTPTLMEEVLNTSQPMY